MKKLFIGLASAAAAISALCLAFTQDTPDKPKNYKNTDNSDILPLGETEVLAHRSGADLAPENTMMAFQNIIRHKDDFKIYGFEFDLHLTKDGEIIILHDDTLDRTSNSEEHFGKDGIMPCDISIDELDKLNMGEKFKAPDGSYPYKGLRGNDIPGNLHPIKLSDVFNYLKPYGSYTFTVDIKNDGETGLKAADTLYKILNNYNMLEKTAVASFHKSNIKYLDEKYPDITRSATIHEVVKFYFQSFFNIPHKEFKFKYLHIPYKDYFFNLGTTRLVNYAHKHNIAVQYWTINEPKIMKKLQSVGADAIFTDVPDLAYKVLKDKN